MKKYVQGGAEQNRSLSRGHLQVCPWGGGGGGGGGGIGLHVGLQLLSFVGVYG